MIGSVKAQPDFIHQKYTISFSHEPLDTVINRLQKLVNAGFSYNPGIVVRTKLISNTFINQDLNVILDSICLPNQLTYKVLGHNIAIAGNFDNKRGTNQDTPGEIHDYFQAAGRIVDYNSKNPISYADVYINNNTIGTLSNNDGNFILKIPLAYKSDSLHFSCLGYKTFSILIDSLSPEVNLVALKPLPIYIKEVEVKPVEAIKLIQDAIDKIPVNYSRIPLINTAFYRELVRENNYYVNLSEAVLSIYKEPYDSYKNDQVIILKGRKSSFVKPMDTLFFKLQGGPFISLLLDIAKNKSIILSNEYLNDYNFKLEDIVIIKDRPVYLISFDQKDNIQYPLYKGKLYIDRRTMAFVRADFMISPKEIDHAARLMVLKSPHKVKVKLLSAKYLVDYKQQNNSWSLNNVREEITFKVSKRFTFFSKIYFTKTELLITKTDSINVHSFKKHEILKEHDVFIEKLGRYDESFWGGYNIIKPDESIEDELQKVDRNK